MLKKSAVLCFGVLVAIYCLVLLGRSRLSPKDLQTAEVDIRLAFEMKDSVKPDLLNSLNLETESFLQDLESRQIKSVCSEPSPEPVSQPTERKRSDMERLSEKTDAWRYRAYVQLGTMRYGTLEDMSSGEMIRIYEGGVLNGVCFESICDLSCVAIVGEASRCLLLENIPSHPTDTPLDPNCPEYRRFLEYRGRAEPKMRELFIAYRPRTKNSPLMTPPSPEELEAAVADYFATVRPTVEAGGEIGDIAEQGAPSEGMSEFEEWVDTYRSVWRNEHQ